MIEWTPNLNFISHFYFYIVFLQMRFFVPFSPILSRHSQLILLPLICNGKGPVREDTRQKTNMLQNKVKPECTLSIFGYYR